MTLKSEVFIGIICKWFLSFCRIWGKFSLKRTRRLWQSGFNIRIQCHSYRYEEALALSVVGAALVNF